ncbi:MAG: hypothetical protein GXY52_00280 [Chloroflexi bacterium]|nr:hypothetical protein [Chloroflexota bacterium]
MTLSARLGQLDLTTVIAVLLNRTVVATIAGQSAARVTGEWLATAYAKGARVLPILMILALVIHMTILVIAASGDRRRLIPLIGAYLVVAILSILSAWVGPDQHKIVLVPPGAAIRYFYAPSADAAADPAVWNADERR